MIAHGGLRPLPYPDDEPEAAPAPERTAPKRRPPGAAGSLELHLRVDDPEIAAELRARPEGRERDAFALAALRLGVLALQKASGDLDARQIQQAGEQLIAQVRELLTQRSAELTTGLGKELEQYLHPEKGHLHGKLQAMLAKDGELERLLRSHLGADESTLARTLAANVGRQSELFRMLSPQTADGLLAQLHKVLEQALRDQRTHILQQFSLDQPDSALSRLTQRVTQQVDSVKREFSLEEEGSALQRLKAILDQAKGQIDLHLTLDQEQSALARLKRELQATLDDVAAKNAAFHTEVRSSLAALQARREEARRSTRHGIAFEEQVGELLALETRKLGDLCEAVGATTGAIARTKVGDFVLVLGPDSGAPGARIAVEAKEHQGYDLGKALDELHTARENRDAQFGLFVFSARTAPPGLPPLTRHGDDVVLVWDEDDPGSDVNLRAAYGVARALCVRAARADAGAARAAREVEIAARSIERQIQRLEQFKTWGDTVQGHGEKIAGQAAAMRKELQAEVDRLHAQVAALKSAPGA